MSFFSGFALRDEEIYFGSYMECKEFNVAGFSYGAIKAKDRVLKLLEQKKRVDRLTLLSPAFFQSKDERFKRLQLMGYSKNPKAYIDEFLNSCFAPYHQKPLNLSTNSLEELRELLYFEWDMDELIYISKAGVSIEIYLGGKDAIIDAKGAYDFFKSVGCVTYIKDANHFLLVE